MTKEIDTKTIEGKIDVMNAYKLGKIIEYKTCWGEKWNIASTPCWDWKNYDYRIQPECDDDPYKKFKDALKAGKRVRFKNYPWASDISLFDWNCPPEEYEIEPDVDPHAHLKTALAEGKRVRRFQHGSQGHWLPWAGGPEGWHWDFPPSDYEIEEVDPYKKFKDAMRAGKRVRCIVGSNQWRSDPLDFSWTADVRDYEIEEVDPYKKFKDALKAGKRVRCSNGHNKWSGDICQFTWGAPPETYEIEPDPVYVPLTSSDIPPVCWLRSLLVPNGDGSISLKNLLVSEIYANVIRTSSDTSHTYEDLMQRFEYSTDRKTWKRCRKLLGEA